MWMYRYFDARLFYTILNYVFCNIIFLPIQKRLFQKLLSSDNTQHYEQKNTNKIKKISKSKATLQKHLPTYVVAFAIQETYDEPPTGRQKLCKIRSLSETVSSITPNASSTMMILNSKSAQRLAQESDVHQRDNEVKIEIEEHDKQSGDVKKDPPQTTVYIADDNIAEDSVNIQPQVLFDSTKNKPRIARKRSKTSNHTVTIRNLNFKSKNIKKKIKQFYLEGNHSSAGAQIRKDLCSVAISNVLSRPRFLKTTQDTDNLLEATGQSSSDELDYNGHDTENTLLFSNSTSKLPSTNPSSQNTLTRESSSTTSRPDDDFFSIDTESVVKLEISPEITGPYKSNIVDLTVAYNTVLPGKEKLCAENERFSFGNLTSTETLTTVNGPLTSQAPLDDSKTYENITEILCQQDFSDKTLKGQNTFANNSSVYDQYFITKTGSDFEKPSFDSAYIGFGSGFYGAVICDKNEFPQQIMVSNSVHRNNSKRSRIFDTVINLGIYPELVPSTSSADKFKDSFENEVIVTDKQASLPQTNTKTCERIKKSRNIFKKCHNNAKSMSRHKNLSLPNNAAIRAMIHDNDMRKMNIEQTNKSASTPEVLRSMPELWDGFTLLLDLALKKLEETLAEKIIKEIKSMSISDSQPIPQMNKVETHVITANKSLDIKFSVEKASEHKEVLVKQESITIIDGDKNFQCDLIESKVIDQLMLRLSIERPKVSRVSPMKILKAPSLTEKMKEPQVLKKCFELLNPLSSDTPTLEEIKPAETSATETLMSNNTAVCLQTFSSRFKSVLETPAQIIKENALVITTVPVFFLGLFSLYCLIALATKL